MNLRNIIREEIKQAIKNYDFDEYVRDELDNINIEAIVEGKLESELDNIDFEEIVRDAIDDIFEEEFDAYEISEIIKKSMED